MIFNSVSIRFAKTTLLLVRDFNIRRILSLLKETSRSKISLLEVCCI